MLLVMKYAQITEYNARFGTNGMKGEIIDIAVYYVKNPENFEVCLKRDSTNKKYFKILFKY